MMRPSQPARPRLEALEDRCNPAGTVHASFDAAGNYLVVGDSEGNELRFENTGAGINLVGENGTTVTGPGTGVDVSGQVTFRLRGGDDRLLISGGMGFGKGLRVDLGTGSNSLEMTGAGYTINGAFDIVQGAGPTPFTTASVKLASQPGDTFAILGPLTYTSVGRVDDTFEVGVGNANNAFVQGAITARLGAGENDADIRVLSAAGITIAEQSAALQSYSINVSVPTVRGSVVATLGAGGGQFQATHSNVMGRFAVTNNPTSRSTVGITVALGEVAESFTVRSRSVTQSVMATFTKIGTNLSVTGGGTQFTNISLTGGEVVGSATVTTSQPNSTNPANQSNVMLTSTTIGGALTVTNTGPLVANSNVDLQKVGQDFRMTVRGADGTTAIHTDEVVRNAAVAATGTGVQANLGAVGGFAQVAIGNTTSADVLVSALNGPMPSSVTFTDVAVPTLQVQQSAGPIAVNLARPQNGTVAVTNGAQKVDVNVVGGTASAVTVQNSTLAKNLNLTATGDTTTLTVQNVTVTGDLMSRGLGRTVVNMVSGGSVGGLASFAGGNQAAGSFRVQLDDLILGKLTYTGGAGRNFLDLDTRAGLAGTMQVTGTSRVILGGGDDEVTFGGLTNDPVPVPDPATQVEFLGEVLVNGGPGADKLFNRNATFIPPAELTTVSVDVL